MSRIHGTSHLDRFQPSGYVGRCDSVHSPAAPEATYRAVRELTVREVPSLHAVLWLRTLLGRLHDRGRSPRMLPDRRVLDTFLDYGFVTLLEAPPEEILIGGVGRFWRPVDHLPLRSLRSAEDFLAFRDPGWVKAVFQLGVQVDTAGSRVRSEIRMAGTDAQADRAFRRYWRLIRPVSGYLRRRALRAAVRRVNVLPDP